MNRSPAVNDLWQYIGEHQVNRREIIDNLAEFKVSQLNYRLTCFDVQTNGVRYLKTLIYNLAAGLSPESRERLRRIPNRDVGSPYSVVFDGDRICLDYLRALLDLEFVEQGVDLNGAAVLEIGAGYGRTCHTLLALHDLATYTIIDLPTTLEVSRVYLGTVLDESELAKVTFVPIEEIDGRLGDSTYDLCVNIDSLAEMDVETVRYYQALIDARCAHFYTNNPVGKYMDKSLDGHGRGEQAIARALSPGLLTDIVDIDDNRAVTAQAPRFVDAYRPADGWDVVSDAWAPPYTWYWQALYRRWGSTDRLRGAGGRP